MQDDDIEVQKNALYETEADRLQREADAYTKDLEHERKKLLIIEDQFKSTNERLEEIQLKIKACIPDKEKEHRE